MFRLCYIGLAISMGVTANPAQADELFVGVAGHQVVTPIAKNREKEGVDVQLGYRWDKADGLAFIGSPSPYILASINIDDGTSFAAAGLSWKFGTKFYVRPGIGVAIHDGPELEFASDGSQTQLGSRVLFQPELSVGVRLTDRIDVEASWLHLSHAKIFSRVQNTGIDSIGARIVVKLP